MRTKVVWTCTNSSTLWHDRTVFSMIVARFVFANGTSIIMVLSAQLFFTIIKSQVCDVKTKVLTMNSVELKKTQNTRRVHRTRFEWQSLRKCFIRYFFSGSCTWVVGTFFMLYVSSPIYRIKFHRKSWPVDQNVLLSCRFKIWNV